MKTESTLQELQKFAIFIIRRFIEVAQKNRKAYMELLFWKTTRDATEVVEGYNAETDNKKVSRSLWTEAQEDELRTLFMEHQTNKYSQGTLLVFAKSYDLRVFFNTQVSRIIFFSREEMALFNSPSHTFVLYFPSNISLTFRQFVG